MLSKETSISLNNRDNLTLKQEFNWESSIGKYTLPCVKQIASGKLLYHTGSSAWCSVTIERGGIGWRGGGREVWEEGDLCIFMADSYCCMEETKTTVQSNYPPIKHKLKNTNKAKKQTKKQQFSILASKGNQLQLIHLGSYKNADAWIQLCASSQAKC